MIIALLALVVLYFYFPSWFWVLWLLGFVLVGIIGIIRLRQTP